MLGTTLFDRLIPAYLKLPRPPGGGGQVIVASGDVLLDFDAEEVVFSGNGVTGVGVLAKPEVAKGHGVYCRLEDGGVRRFLQKPSIERQMESGAVNPYGQAILDIGILHFTPDAALRFVGLCRRREGVRGGRGRAWRGSLGQAFEAKGLDIYREICCALGRDTRPSGYLEEVRRAGSSLDAGTLRAIYRGLRPMPFHVHVVPRLRFLHFGTLQDLIESGKALLTTGIGDAGEGSAVIVNSRASGSGSILGKSAWVEGCRIEAPLSLAGDNVVVGLDADVPLSLRRGECLDLIAGRGRRGRRGWFFRVYSADDPFQAGAERGARLCGLPLAGWLKALGPAPANVWGARLAAEERTVWNGRFFPFLADSAAQWRWLWLLDPRRATHRQREEWLSAERYSFGEIALRADFDSFHARRLEIRSELLRKSISRLFGPDGELSAGEIALLIRRAAKSERGEWLLALFREAVRSVLTARTQRSLGSLGPSRILHKLGSALVKAAGGGEAGKSWSARDVAGTLEAGLTAAEKACLSELGLPVRAAAEDFKAWAGDPLTYPVRRP